MRHSVFPVIRNIQPRGLEHRGKEGNVLISRLYWALVAGKAEEMMRLPEGLFARANYQIHADAEPKAKLNGIRRLRRRS